MINHFPLGLAKGEAFCNRSDERAQLINNIQNHRHSFIVSPRRYGKSSLVTRVLDEHCVPHISLDLFITVDEAWLARELLLKANDLINQLSNKHEATFRVIKETIKQLNLKLIVGIGGVNIEVFPDKSIDPIQSIRDTLLLLEQFLAHKKQTAVLFVDEFQEVAHISKSRSIEGAIRHVAQQTNYLNFIFSGSHRQLLSQLFETHTRPLYKLCERLSLDRIHATDYQSHFQKCALPTWEAPLSEKITLSILQLTERHPYYVNLLCGRVWLKYEKKTPTQTHAIKKIWHDIVNENRSDVLKELSALSDLQSKIMIQIALGNDYQLRSKENLKIFNASSSAITKSLRLLEEKDYVLQTEKGAYAILDPLIATCIRLGMSP